MGQAKLLPPVKEIMITAPNHILPLMIHHLQSFNNIKLAVGRYLQILTLGNRYHVGTGYHVSTRYLHVYEKILTQLKYNNFL